MSNVAKALEIINDFTNPNVSTDTFVKIHGFTDIHKTLAGVRDALQPSRYEFSIGQKVFKASGDYTGPGVVKAIIPADDDISKDLYLVAAKVEGGTGVFLHIYHAGNLRSIE